MILQNKNSTYLLFFKIIKGFYKLLYFRACIFFILKLKNDNHYI